MTSAKNKFAVAGSRKLDDWTLNARRFLVATLLGALVVQTCSGCNGVRRRLTITSEPPGATVYLNNKEIGKTPISQNFLYSGIYNIKCYKDGYEMKETYYKAGCPWYLYPGVDFFSENFTPGELRDEQSCHIELEQKREIPENELAERASKLREEAHQRAGSLNVYSGANAGVE
ncbi:MAG: PEGA domain-containing protein [Thermoguttaceae bacterium]|nr:PEGA domain-containing protein [Thermoguttaceae bacterium]